MVRSMGHGRTLDAATNLRTEGTVVEEARSLVVVEEDKVRANFHHDLPNWAKRGHASTCMFQGTRLAIIQAYTR